MVTAQQDRQLEHSWLRGCGESRDGVGSRREHNTHPLGHPSFPCLWLARQLAPWGIQSIGAHLHPYQSHSQDPSREQVAWQDGVIQRGDSYKAVGRLSRTPGLEQGPGASSTGAIVVPPFTGQIGEGEAPEHGT